MCNVVVQVLPEYLKKTVGGLLTDPFASACLPEVAAAMQPHLNQLQPKAAQLLSHVALAARQSTQLGHVLQSATQVTLDQASDSAACQWNRSMPELDQLNANERAKFCSVLPLIAPTVLGTPSYTAIFEVYLDCPKIPGTTSTHLAT